MTRIEAAWLREPATRRLIEALDAAAIEARFVGGCVRDTLLSQPIGDIDIATPARPEAVIAALQRARIKAVPTGLAHGTVTAVLPPLHFEITTLRRDVETDGRHAVVAFDADWAEDAARRDFTINAIYLSPDGMLYDPVGGRADLIAQCVRFVGDPATRIAEDVLRILRYYRFEARFGSGYGDPTARATCRSAAGNLSTLSAERIAQELMRLLAATDPVPALRLMKEDGVLAAVLPTATRIDRLAGLIGLAPESDALLRLAALIEVDTAGAGALAERLRLSSPERKRLVGLAMPWSIDPGADLTAQRAKLYLFDAERYRDIALLEAAEGRIPSARLGELLDLATTWKAPKFPLNGDDVTALGIQPGPQVGLLLTVVRRWWEGGNFTADRARCLVQLREVAQAPEVGPHS